MLLTFCVRGEKFQPEVELAKTKLKPYKIHHAGDVINRKRGDFVYKDSGFFVKIGPKGNGINNDINLTAQIKAAVRFIKRNSKEIKLLKNADEKILHFGYGLRFDKTGEPFWVQFDKLPPDFLKMCGELKIEINLSFYYGFTVDRLISHYVKILKLKYPKRKRVGK
jgi:hypothetical protein